MTENKKLKMAEMTREEVEERLEEFAAYKSVKETHEDTEQSLIEESSEKIESDDANIENSIGDKDNLEEDLLLAEAEEVVSEVEFIPEEAPAPSLNDCDLSELNLSDLN